MAEMTGAAIQESSSVSEEPADPASHTPVRQTVYRTEAPPASQRNPMVDPQHQDLTLRGRKRDRENVKYDCPCPHAGSASPAAEEESRGKET